MSDTAKKPLGARSIQSHQAILQVTLELLAVGYEHELTRLPSWGGQNYHLSALRLQRKLVADAIEPAGRSIYQTLAPSQNMDALIPNAAQYVQSPLARQTIAMIISAASVVLSLHGSTRQNI